MKKIFLFNLLLIGCQNVENIFQHNPILFPISDAGIIQDSSLQDVQDSNSEIETLATHCPDNMVYVKNGNFCMDQFEYPNVKGAYPDFAMSAYEAEGVCHALSKRLCTHTEWLSACLGSKNLAYGYGEHWNSNACNDNTNTSYIPVDWSRMEDPVGWKKYAATLYKGVKSGSKEGCFSIEDDKKIYDLIGNVREWVKDPYGYGGYAFESSFWYGTMSGAEGCFFTVRNHSPNFASYEVGSRCCEDAK